MDRKFERPIIGQEAICPDGLGRVVEYEDNFPERWIKVETYFNNRGCKWASENVILVNLAINKQSYQQSGKGDVV